MWKVAWLTKFRPGMEPEEAKHHWHDVHGAIMLSVPGVLGYVQNYRSGPILGPNASVERSFDGYSVGWFESRDSYEAALKSPQWQRLHDDSPNVFDNSSMLTVYLDEQIMRPVPRER